MASSLGRSAICVVRLSGEGVLGILETIFFPRRRNLGGLAKNPQRFIPGKLHFKDILIDEVVVIPFAAPHSYTGEEAAEVHTHGNPVIVKRVLSIFYQLGIQKAGPGEFTKRAFLSGKIDLPQAEAIHEIIQAKSEWGVQKAFQMKEEGFFRKMILHFRGRLMNLFADLSAELDLTEEGIDFSDEKEKNALMAGLIGDLEKTLSGSKRLKVFREGIEIVIGGPPNAGKSSLLNFLAGEERAIVSQIPGTTRDYIQVELEIQGIPVHFVDTAGIRNVHSSRAKKIGAHTEIEQIGIQKSLDKFRTADIVIWMLDASKPRPKEGLPNQFPANPGFPEALTEGKTEDTAYHADKYFFIVNKKDIAHPSWKTQDPLGFFERDRENGLFISLKTGENSELVQTFLERMIEKKTLYRDGMMLSVWQTEMLSKILSELKNAQGLIKAKEMPEIVVSSLQMALNDLAQITGEITNEEILGRIFSRFCVGK